jgi:hypothetical protein
MADSDQEQPRGHASTSFRWNYGGKEGREVFALETTISGNPTDVELDSHIASAIKAMGSVVHHGGRARQPQTDPDQKSGATTIICPATQSELYHWIQGRTGKPILVLQGSISAPHEVECPIHPGKMMTRRSTVGGSWLTHPDGDTYCTARIERIPQGTD